MRHCGQSFKTISQTCCESSAFVSAVSRGICQETDGREIDAGYRSRPGLTSAIRACNTTGSQISAVCQCKLRCCSMTCCRYAATARVPDNHARVAIRPNTSRPGRSSGYQSAGGMFFAAVVRSKTPITSPTSSFPRSAIGASQRLDRKPLPSFHFFVAFGVAIEGTLKVSECNHKARPAVPEAKLENIMLDESP